MATLRQKNVVKKILENGGNVSKAMRDSGYSPLTAKTPSKLTDSQGFKNLLEKYLPDKLLTQKHLELLNATDIGHMVFPLKTTDQEIKELLASVNCTPKKIQHGMEAIHVWFWARNNKAIKDALELAYKLKGSFAPEKKEISGGLNLPALFDSSDDE